MNILRICHLLGHLLRECLKKASPEKSKKEIENDNKLGTQKLTSNTK